MQGSGNSRTRESGPNTSLRGDQLPLVSIVLPTYNGSRYLREAIESCLAQTYQNWELILVDDCSKDATPDIIAEFTRRDPRIRSIRHKVNKKLPEALNTGHAAARGEYLTWTSDDNRFLPAAIEEMTAYLEQHPSTALVYTDCVLIDEAGQYLHDFPAQPPSRLAYMDALGACFLYRRAVYETLGGYDVDLFLAEDYEYWLRAYRQFELAPLHKTLYEYRWHDQSLTKSANRLAIRTGAERALRRHLPHLGHCLPEDRARGWTVCAANAVRRGDLPQAVTAYARALRIAPASSLGYVGRKLIERLQRRHAGAEMMPNGEWSQRSTSAIQ
jgi:glycosyltransferase involved in cell wall biosynthesis